MMRQHKLLSFDWPVNLCFHPEIQKKEMSPDSFLVKTCVNMIGGVE